MRTNVYDKVFDPLIASLALFFDYNVMEIHVFCAYLIYISYLCTLETCNTSDLMLLIDQPFKRVAIDLVGSIAPVSDKGHGYILTLVNYATRYPEAVALKNNDTETVAEALLDMYSRVGASQEVLSDLGTQFTSDCMKEASRLLTIRRLTTSPYHPACNGLLEKFNGTMKQMLRRLCH